MEVSITARHMEGGSEHEHIAAVKWIETTNPSNDGNSTREEMIEWIESGNVKAYVWDVLRPGPEVRVVRATPPYLRSFADNEPTDNLLALPEF
jgi:hypothetical protein